MSNVVASSLSLRPTLLGANRPLPRPACRAGRVFASPAVASDTFCKDVINVRKQVDVAGSVIVTFKGAEGASVQVECPKVCPPPLITIALILVVFCIECSAIKRSGERLINRTNISTALSLCCNTRCAATCRRLGANSGYISCLASTYSMPSTIRRVHRDMSRSNTQSSPLSNSACCVDACVLKRRDGSMRLNRTHTSWMRAWVRV